MVDFTPGQKKVHDSLLDVVARILAFCHGQQNVKFMMTTIRRQAASCLFGLTPLLKDILAGKLSRLELMEVGDSDEDVDLSFVDQVRTDIASLIEQAGDIDPRDPNGEAYVEVLGGNSTMPTYNSLSFTSFRHPLSD